MSIIPRNLPECTFGMPDASISTVEIARVVGICSRAIRYTQMTGCTDDLPCQWHPCVTMWGQDQHIIITHLHNWFQTATANADNTHVLHYNLFRRQTVCNRLREKGLFEQWSYVSCILMKRLWANCLNWAFYMHVRPDFAEIQMHSQMNPNSYNKVVMVGYASTNEHFSICCVVEQDHFGGGGSVMVPFLRLNNTDFID